MHRLKSLALAAAFTVMPALVSAQNILIIYGASGTSETGTTASITNNPYVARSGRQYRHNFSWCTGRLLRLLAGVGHSLLECVCTHRRSAAQYLSYLQGGVRVFMMDENSGFTTRKGTIFSLIGAAGGGNLAAAAQGCDATDTQTVNAPFTGPNAVSSLTFACAANFNGTGTGQWITNNGSIGAGVAWTFGTLANATAGSLPSILDVNFMEGNRTFEMQQLTKNLIGFVNNPRPVGDVVPEPSTYALMATGFVGLVGLSRGRRVLARV